MNLAAWLARAARSDPRRTAVYSGDRAWADYGTLALRVARVAAGLAASGLERGDRVAIFMKNAPEYLEAMYAIWWAGLAAVPVNAKLTYNGRRTLANGVVIDFDNGRVARPALKPPPVRKNLASTIAASRATINVDGKVDDWKNVKSQIVKLDTGGRAKMTANLRFAWDPDFLYVLVEQTAPADRVHEAPDLAAFSNATWDWDSVALNFDVGNGKLPCIGDFVFHLAFNSSGASDLFFAPSGKPKETRIHTATSGSADKGNRVIEARIAWAGLIGFAFNNNQSLAKQFGEIKPGLRFGCEPMLAEYNHKGQSYIGGGHYKKPTGFDDNSRDILLQE